jgi:hypothetical protein
LLVLLFFIPQTVGFVKPFNLLSICIIDI